MKVNGSIIKKKNNEQIIFLNGALPYAKPKKFSKLKVKGLRYSVRLNLRIKIR